MTAPQGRATTATGSAPARAGSTPASRPNDLLEAALGYAALGWKVFPIKPGAKAPPFLDAWQINASSDPDQIRAWWSETPLANIGLNCGASGLLALDLDTKPDKKTGLPQNGINEWQALALKHGFPADGTRTSRTPSGGLHLLYLMPEKRLRNTQGDGNIAPGIDRRGDDGYIVAPPSIIGGVAYRWENPGAPILALPQVAADLLHSVTAKKKAKPAKAAPPARPAAAPAGGAALVSGSLLDLVQADGYALTAKSGQHEGPCPFCKAGEDRFYVAHDSDTVQRDGTRDYYSCRQCMKKGDRQVAGDKVSWLVDYRGMGVVEAFDACGIPVPAEFRKIPARFGAGAATAGEDMNTSWVQPGTDGKPLPVPGAIRAALEAEEVGDAHLFADIYRDKRCYDLTAKKWYRWAGNYWEEHESIMADLDALVKLYKDEALVASAQASAARKDEVEQAADGDAKPRQESPAEKYRKALLKRLRDLNKAQRRENVLKMAREGVAGSGDFDRLGILGTAWDQKPYTLACANGVLELTSTAPNYHEFRPGRPEDYIKAVVPTKWLGINEQAKRWAEMIVVIFTRHHEVVPFLARLFGYALAGAPIEHIFVVFWGPGRNGKGVIIRTLQFVLGKGICAEIKPEIFLHNPNKADSSRARPEVMKLRGVRLAMGSEIEAGRKMNAAELKNLTGGDRLTGRQLYGEEQEFVATHTLFQQTNHRIGADAKDQAIWDRMLEVPFLERFVKAGEGTGASNEHEADLTLEADLKAEASGILAWLVRGWQDYAARHNEKNTAGLAPPDVVRNSTKAYRNEMDSEARFLAWACEDVRGGRVKAGDVKKAFDAWCHENGIRNGSINLLRKMILKPTPDSPDNTGTHEKKTSGGTFYLDMELTEEARELLDAGGPGTQQTLMRGAK